MAETRPFLAKWDDVEVGWAIKAPSSGWTWAPKAGASARNYSAAQLAELARRMFGHQAVKGAPIVVVEGDGQVHQVL